MNLSKLLQLLHDVPEYQQLIQGLREVSGTHRVIVLDSARSYLLACIYRELRIPLVVITAQAERGRQLCDEINFWLDGAGVVQFFPEPDALPYERLSSAPRTVEQRLRVLFHLDEAAKLNGPPPIIITSAHAVMQKTLNRNEFANSCRMLKRGMIVDMQELLTMCIAMGYELVNTVETPGTLSRRGGIIDIYSPNSHLPARIELLGNQVESIRLYEPDTQRSTGLVSSFTIIPAQEILIHGDYQLHDILDRLDLSSCNSNVKERIEREIELLLKGSYFEDRESYRPLFNNGILLDYLPATTLIVLEERERIETEFDKLDLQATELRQGLMARGDLPGRFPIPYFAWQEFTVQIQKVPSRLEFGGWGTDDHYRFPFILPPRYDGKLPVFFDELRELLQQRKRVIIISQQDSRLSEILKEEGFEFLSSLDGLKNAGSITLLHGSPGTGWTLGLEVNLLTDREIFGIEKKRRLVEKRRSRSETFLADLSEGDLVVHSEHGIARFGGMARMVFHGGERDSLVLEFADNARIYVPTDYVDCVSRYIGAGATTPSLSRLGTQEWVRAKQRVKEKAVELARELLDLYSAREVVTGFSFSQDTIWQQELEASFPYVETPDQVNAIREIKEDMEKTKPMDRLICGDVGYGKTEVAIRAAFKAVLDGMQVAMLVPTTVLAQQHYKTFTERLAAFPVTVDVLSRFRSDREQQDILAQLKDGTVDICIGTHRLLQPDVFFKNLGLVIIDEEQRFGVAHKERLKQIRREVDVLTLTATPIPRTLHMALTGVRDMSIMDTPPEERLPIKTYVTEYDEILIREAVLRELDRGGQIFFVHNRVETIEHIATRLADIIPEAKIAVAHGQMHEHKLESVMLDFAEGKSNILVCTTIIESGLDMPNVNTILVNNADKLGLYQLYQLRGRVGRGANRAFAYFLYNKGKELTDTAQERLKTIFHTTELGSGFRIAMKDLEIRGAGNLIGAEQSGHISAVGFALYSRLLSEAVEEQKARRDGEEKKKPPARLTPSISLPIEAYIPEDYVPDIGSRLGLYRRLIELQSTDEIEQMKNEFKDRFGALPAAVDNLLYTITVKMLCTRAGVESITNERGHITVRMREGIVHSLTAAPGITVGRRLLSIDTNHFRAGWQAALLKLLQRLTE